MQRTFSRPSLAILLTAALAAPTLSQGDPEVIDALIYEGKENSQVWDTLVELSETIGPRLTGSTSLSVAEAWARDRFHRMGLDNVHLARWGEVPVRFDRGSSYAHVEAPEHRELEFTARSWSAGTDGPQRGRVFLLPTAWEELDLISGELEGAFVLCPTPPRRRSAQESEEERTAREEASKLREEVLAAMKEEGIAGTLTSSGSELVITSSIRGWRDLTMDTLPTDVEVVVTQADYEAMKASIEAGEEVEVELDLAHHFAEGPFPQFNVVAEIRGTEKPEEVVIFSGHLDTWDGPGTQGAQDNGTGTSAVLEAARILTTVGVEPKRTIRFVLWGGEEQGLFGSRAYVAQLSEEERAGISCVLVDDGGTNYQGGLVGIESQMAMLDEAIGPIQEAFPDLPMENTARDRMPRGGGSDHASFNQVGIPGFFWKESGSGGREGKNYTFIHHTQHDTLRYAVPEYLVQSATCSAVVLYQLAEAETLLPRDSDEKEPVAKAQPVDASFEVTEGPLSGAWTVEFQGTDAPDMELALTLELSADGRVRGQVEGPSGVERIQKGSWEGAEASFVTGSDFGDLSWKTKVEGDQLKGAIDVMGQELAVVGVRATAEAAAAGEIAGRWKGLIHSMDAEFDLVLAVDAAGTLSGRFKSSQSDSELHAASWDPDEQRLAFEYDYPHAGRLPVSARLVDGKLVGRIGENADFEAVRVVEE